MSNLPKISIIGAGNVGASAAYRALELNLSDVVLLDIVEGLPQGKALDLTQMLSVSGSSSKIIGTNDYSDTKNSDLVIITSRETEPEHQMYSSRGCCCPVLPGHPDQRPKRCSLIYQKFQDASSL